MRQGRTKGEGRGVQGNRCAWRGEEPQEEPKIEGREMRQRKMKGWSRKIGQKGKNIIVKNSMKHSEAIKKKIYKMARNTCLVL